jgi:hypothetical protein
MPRLPDYIEIGDFKRIKHKFYLSHTEVKLDRIKGTNIYKLRNSLHLTIASIDYEINSHFNSSVAVPSNFTTDLASIPNFLRFLVRPDGPWAVASIVHDFLYTQEACCPRWMADIQLFVILRAFGVPLITCSVFWTSVTLFGWMFYPTKNRLIQQ